MSAPDGDIPLETLGPDQPFSLTPEKKHPFLTLGHYFDAIANFVVQDECAVIKKAYAVISNQDIAQHDILKIIIRSEKHGALYHIASLEIFIGAQSFRLAVTTAIGPENTRILAREFEILRRLPVPGRSYLPRTVAMDEEHCRAGARSEVIMIMLGEWLAGFHEWHLALDNTDQTRKILLWDSEKGHRFLATADGFEIIRQAAKILTSYYDPESFRQIYPWHHAAGDFVVQKTGNDIAVRLITARNYAPQLEFNPDDPDAPTMALLSFLLNLTIRIRLDRLDGVGDVAWLDSFAVQAAVTGFFEALPEMDWGGKGSEFLNLLRSFNPEELAMLCNPLLELYNEEDPDDFTMVQTRLSQHCSRLWQCLQDFEL